MKTTNTFTRDELIGKIESLQEENRILREDLERAYKNDNFGCYSRIGGIIRGNQYLEKERRRVASGEIVILTADVGGMGAANSRYGEIEVNLRMFNCLQQISSWRGVCFLSQLNSGDEFVFLVDRDDAPGLLPRMNSLFCNSGFYGLYAAISTIEGDYIEAANQCMRLVYEHKRLTKLLRAVLPKPERAIA